MSINTREEFLKQYERYQYNPSGIARLMFEALDTEIMDPTIPLVGLVEATAMTLSCFNEKNADEDRRRYVKMTTNRLEDINLHLSDKDILNRFALPAETDFYLVFSERELLTKLVPVDGLPNTSQIVIPRNSNITVGDMVFTMQYPVVIRRLPHGGLNIFYDVSKRSPLQSLSTNMIRWQKLYHRDDVQEKNAIIRIPLRIKQMQIQSVKHAISVSAGAVFNVPFKDAYYSTRVYLENADKSWTEIRTTLTDQTFDRNTPTALLQVLEQSVQVKIPQIYLTTGAVTSSIRVDVHTTKGPIISVLGNYTENDFKMNFTSVDRNEMDKYVAPLSTLKTIGVYSDKTVTGGSRTMTPEETRAMVIWNKTGDPSLPITDEQIQSSLERKGYTIVKTVDTVNTRAMMATRNMPDPSYPDLITAANSSIETLTSTMERIAAHGTVIDNGDSITILPDTIYRLNSGILEIVPKETVDAILRMDAEQRAERVTDAGFRFSPFHYCMDIKTNEANGLEFDCRPYYLSKPNLNSQSLGLLNATTMLQVSSDSMTVELVEDGYKITVLTLSNDLYKSLDVSQLHVQLAYIPFGETERAYLNGTHIGRADNGEHVFEFNLRSRFRLDQHDQDNTIEFLNFYMFDLEDRKTRSVLDQDFEFIYSVSDYNQDLWRPNEIDDVVGKFLLPAGVKGITQEDFKFSIGHRLSTLWSRSKSIVMGEQYQRYEADIPAVWETDNFERYPDGTYFQIVNGEVVMNLLNPKGSPKLDDQGDPIYLFRKNQVMLDSNNNPIPKSPRTLGVRIDLMMLEGVYWFATNPVAVNYLNDVKEILLSWLTNDLESLKEKLLDQTRIYFYPKATTGKIMAMVEDGRTVQIEAGQRFTIKFLVSDRVYNNLVLRREIEDATTRAIAAGFTKKELSISNWISNFTDLYRDDVLDVEISGFEDNRYHGMMIINDTDRCSIRKRLTPQSDDSLIVTEDIDYQFVRHAL